MFEKKKKTTFKIGNQFYILCLLYIVIKTFLLSAQAVQCVRVLHECDDVYLIPVGKIFSLATIKVHNEIDFLITSRLIFVYHAPTVVSKTKIKFFFVFSI